MTGDVRWSEWGGVGWMLVCECMLRVSMSVSLLGFMCIRNTCAALRGHVSV